MIGTTINRKYKILDKLGQGGMGEVFLAEDLRLGRQLAIKFLLPDFSNNKNDVQRFVSVAKAASALDHKNICTIYDADKSENGMFYFCMPYYSNTSLKQILRNTPLPINRAIQIIRQIAEGLQAAHRANIIHRDIKPGNIMVQQDDSVKIIDFGLAKLNGNSFLTQTGKVLGTVAYMAPEQAQSSNIDKRADLWSLGVIFYEMLSGRLPFSGEGDLGIMYNIVHTEPIPLDITPRPAIFAQLNGIISKLLDKNPDKRFQSASEVLTALDNLEKGKYRTSVNLRRFVEPIKKLSWAALFITFIATTYYFIPPTAENNISRSSTSDRIAVFPFELNGPEEFDYLKMGVSDLLSVKFDGAGNHRRVDPRRLQDILPETGESLTGSKLAELAQNLEARRYISGNIYVIGDQIQITASLYDLNEDELKAVETSPAQYSKLPHVIDELGRLLLTGLRNSAGVHSEISSDVQTNSAAALKYFMTGEQAARLGRYREGIEFMEAATREDSTFAMAWYRMALFAGYEPTYYNKTHHAIQQALTYRKKLPEYTQLAIKGMFHHRRWEFLKAEQYYKAVLAVYPENKEVYTNLTSISNNFGGRFGRSASETRNITKQALKLDPNNPILFAWMAIASYGLPDKSTSIEYYRKRLEHASSNTYEVYDSLIVIAGEGTVNDLHDFLNRRKRPGSMVWFAGMAVGLMGDFEKGRIIIQSVVRDDMSDFLRIKALQGIAGLFAAEGKLKEAQDLIKRCIDENPNILPDQNILIPLFTGEGISEEISTLLYKTYFTQELKPRFTENTAEVLYAAGHLAAKEGKKDTTQLFIIQLDEQIRELSVNGVTDSVLVLKLSDYNQSLKAALAFQENQFSECISHLDSMVNSRWMPGVSNYIRTCQGLERLMRAESLFKLNRPDEALRWLSTIGSRQMHDFSFKAAAYLLTAEIYAEQGNPADAIVHYQRFIDLYRDCDAEFESAVNTIKERITMLGEST